MAQPIIVEGQTATNPTTKARVVYRKGKWYPIESDPGGGGAPPLTEDQGKMTGALTEMATAEGTYRAARQNGYDPTSGRNSFASFLEGLPFGGLDGLGAVVRDPQSDLGRQAELQFSDAQLKAKSGASAPEAEVKRNVQIYFTRPNQNPLMQDPTTERARAAAASAARARAGPGATIAPRFPYTAGPGQSRIPAELNRMTPQQIEAAKRFRGTSARSGTAENPSIPTSKTQRDALPPGAIYVAPDGSLRRKGN